jgi:hypothetical protein
MDADKLLALIEDDDLGLLDVKPQQAYGLSEDERLAESFYEIADFYLQHSREPENDLANVQEYKIATRLEYLRSQPDKVKALADLDEFGLLAPVKTPGSIEDILKDDDLNLLEQDNTDSIFNLRNVPQSIEMPDYVAQRKPCATFKEFEPLFEQCHADLKSGKRQLTSFSHEQQIHKGHFFVLRGVLTYVAQVGEKMVTSGKKNARLHCIFENGTESDMLLRSLACELYKDGWRVSEHDSRLMDAFNNITGEDNQTGTIYVLKSLSANPEIAGIQELYKIGFCTGSVEERIKNAEDDPTYLMAPVHIMETFQCFNLNPQKLELLMHQFFGKVCLEVDVFDKAGKRYTPREWFIAPLAVVEEAIEMIISGTIIGFEYDDELKMICKK